MPTPLILARSFKEAHAFASDELGLRVGHYRVVNTAGTLKAVRGVDLHLVPGWDRNPSHFAMKAALRFAKGLNIVDHAAKAQEPEPVDPRGDLTERQLAVAYRYNTLRDLPLEDLTPEEAVEVAEEAVAQVTQDDDEPARSLAVSHEEFERIQGELAEEPRVVEPLVEKAKSKKRRSRCKDCGNLHYKDEPCPEAD